MFEVTKKEETGIQVQWSKDQIELIKRTVAKGTTNDELQLFLYIAKRTGLDPFARQIYCVKRWDSKEQKNVMTTQTSIDGFRLIADRTGKYAPGEITWELADNGNPISATASIKKLVGGVWHEIKATAFWEEYAQKYTKDGVEIIGAMWLKMPKLMIGKCAEALVLRKAFPAELSGVYTTDEMAQAGSTEPQHTGKPQTAPPQEKPHEEPQEGNKTVEVAIVGLKTQNGVTNGRKWTLYIAETNIGMNFKTFDTKVYDALKMAQQGKVPLIIKYDARQTIQGVEARPITDPTPPPPAPPVLDEIRENLRLLYFDNEDVKERYIKKITGKTKLEDLTEQEIEKLEADMETKLPPKRA